MFRFIHSADIHLDSPLCGLEQYEGAPVDEIRQASRRALENLVRLATEERVDFVLIAGDLYDSDWRDHNTGLFLVKQMTRLRDAGIPMYLIAGNHDAANKMTRSLRLPANPTGDEPLFGHRHAETRHLERLGVAIHGRSFANAAEKGNLSREYPVAEPGMFNIGMLHTSLEGDAQHATYAPCSIDDLRSKAYQYWALGHVHKRRTVCQDPYVAYPGNLQGRHIRETGEKGCLLVAVDDRHHVECQFRPLDVFRWERCDIACDEFHDTAEVLDRFARETRQLFERHAGLPLAVRVTLTGPSPTHQELAADLVQLAADFRAAAIEASGGLVWVEEVKVATSYANVSQAQLRPDGPVGELIRYLDEVTHDDEKLQVLAKDLDGLKAKLPPDLLQGPDALAMDDPAWLREVLAEVKPLLLQRLSVQEKP
jgi:DNA repair protein SbcD/Mre11